MRAVLEQTLGWVVIVGVVAAIVLGKRRGTASRAAAESAAYAAGFAAGGSAAAAAHAQQTVTVAVDASRRGLEGGSAESGFHRSGYVPGVVSGDAPAGALDAGTGGGRATGYDIDYVDDDEWAVPVHRRHASRDGRGTDSDSAADAVDGPSWFW